MTPLEAQSSQPRAEELNSSKNFVEDSESFLSSYRLAEAPAQTNDFENGNSKDKEGESNALPELEVVGKPAENQTKLDFSSFDTNGDFLNHPLLEQDNDGGNSREPKEDKQASQEADDSSTKSADAKNSIDKLPVIELTSLEVNGAEEDSRWHRSEDSGWTFDDGFGGTNSGVKGFDSQRANVQNVEQLEDKSVKLTLDDGQVLRHRPDGSSIQFKNEESFVAGKPNRIYNSDNSTLDIEWSDGNVSSLKDSRGADYSRLSDGSYMLSKSDWKGELTINPENGEITTIDSSKEVTKSTDGSLLEKMPDGSAKLTLKSPQDNTTRIFNFGKDSFSSENQEFTQPETMEVITPDGKSHLWTHEGGDSYKINGSEKPSKFRVSRNSAGEYEYNYQNLKTGYSKTVSNDAVKSIDPESEEIRIEKDGNLAGIRYDESEYKIKHDSKGQLAKIEDVSENVAWLKQEDGSWKPEPMDSTKPYEKPGNFDSKIVSDNDLTAEQKVRMLENTKRINAMGEFDSAEKEKFFNNVSRLLDTKSGTVFSEQERAQMAEQTLWHVANSDQNDQGASLTCNVTTVRGVLLKEQPSVVAGLIADVANNGQITTADGSIIKPPLDSLKPRNNTSEETFPPVDGTRTWLGQVWDVTAANIHYQRQTKDLTGATVPKGSLSYQLLEKEGQSDHGERIIRADSNGGDWTLHKQFSDNTTKPYDGVYLHSSQMLDIYNQLTGKPKEGLMLAESNRYVGNKTDYEKLGGKRAGTEQELHDFLSKADFPVIVQLNSGVLRQNANMRRAIEKGEDPSKIPLVGGGEHVVLINGYEPSYKGNNGSGTVNIDNSWGDINDFATASELVANGIKPNDAMTITVSELLASMNRTVKSSSPGHTWTWVRPYNP